MFSNRKIVWVLEDIRFNLPLGKKKVLIRCTLVFLLRAIFWKVGSNDITICKHMC